MWSSEECRRRDLGTRVPDREDFLSREGITMETEKSKELLAGLYQAAVAGIVPVLARTSQHKCERKKPDRKKRRQMTKVSQRRNRG